MMFRKLYWITEQSSRGSWRATGVYTSIQDLIEHGFRFVGDPAVHDGFRITLCKLDCRKDVLGVWSGPKFQDIETDLQAYVQTGEFTVEEIQQLRQALSAFSVPAQRSA